MIAKRRCIYRAFIFLLLSTVLLLTPSTQASEQISGKMFYTTANIWYETPDHIESTNYHRGSIIPAGTKMKITEVFDGTSGDFIALNPQMLELFIRFEDDRGRSYKLIFRPRHASRGMTVRDLFRQYFSENDPMREGGPFSSLTPDEQQNVKLGEIAAGMSKEAVLMAYGYPPGHRTPSLKSDKWIYWVSRFNTNVVYFSDNKVSRIGR